MTGAITFLQHLRDICKNSECSKCVLLDKDKLCYIEKLFTMNDKDIADLVRKVEYYSKDVKTKNDFNIPV